MLSFNGDPQKDMIIAVYDSHGHKNKSKYVYYYTNEENENALEKPNYDGAFVPFYPRNDDDNRTINYIFGKSGSGKSYLAKILSYYFDKIMRVFVVSDVLDDEYRGRFVNIEALVDIDYDNDYKTELETYKKAKVEFKYYKASIMERYNNEKKKATKNGTPIPQQPFNNFKQKELEIEQLKPQEKKKSVYSVSIDYKKIINKPSLWIYDDTEASSQVDRMTFLQNSQLLTGRHDNINMIIINHLSNSGVKTRNTINEAHTFTFFTPFNRYTSYFLKEYLGLDRKQIKEIQIMLRNSRYITIYKDLNVLLTETKIMII